MSLARSRYIQKMRAKCLLESYYGESTSTATPRHWEEQSIQPESEIIHLQRAPQHWEHSLQPDEEPGEAQGADFPFGMRDDLLQMIKDNERLININPVNAEQIQAIRRLGVNLRRAADRVQIRPARRFLDENLPDLRREGLSNEEIQVVRKIYTETASTTISDIARYLQECLTSETFRMALAFLSSSTPSASEQLAAACELARLFYPRAQEAFQAGPVWDELQKFIEDKLDEVLH